MEIIFWSENREHSTHFASEPLTWRISGFTSKSVTRTLKIFKNVSRLESNWKWFTGGQNDLASVREWECHFERTERARSAGLYITPLTNVTCTQRLEDHLWRHLPSLQFSPLHPWPSWQHLFSLSLLTFPPILTELIQWSIIGELWEDHSNNTNSYFARRNWGLWKTSHTHGIFHRSLPAAS